MMKSMIALFIFILTIPSLVLASANTPVGLWKTIDDVTGEEKSVIQIQASKDQTLTGHIIKLFHDPDKRCEACAGDKKDQPILGMTVIEGLKHDHEEASLWSDGTILDPHNGKTYHCQLQVLDQGHLLRVRGYLGVPLFGRSQTWVRAG